MKHKDVVMAVVQKTGFSEEKCEVVMKAFEQAGVDALTYKKRRERQDHLEMLDNLTQRTGETADDCVKILDALVETIGEGLADKFSFGKKKK